MPNEEADEADAPQPEAPVVVWIADSLFAGHKNQGGRDWLLDTKARSKLEAPFDQQDGYVGRYP